MPVPNRQGAVTNAVCSSRGDDTDSDGIVRETQSLVITKTKIEDFRTTCVTGPQPYCEGKKRASPECFRFPLSAGWNRNVVLRHGGHPVAGYRDLKAVKEVTTV